MCIFEEFLEYLYKYLLDSEDYNNNVIKKHTRKLEQLGEFSLACDILKLKCIHLPSSVPNEITNTDIETLITESKNQKLQITKSILVNRTFHIYLNRSSAFKTVIEQILTEGCRYGSKRLNFLNNICVRTDYSKDSISNINLSQLRLQLLCDVINQFLSFNGYNDNDAIVVDIIVSPNSHINSKCRTIYCAPVTTSCEHKTPIFANELYNKRTIDMRLMAEHKYGLRITSNPGWQEIFRKLGEAAVAIELLQVKTNRTIVCKMNDFSSSRSKGASFILYNCARLSTLLKEYQKKIDSGIYPSLPDFHQIDFMVLTEPEEWEILYVYLLQFPFIIHNCIKDVIKCNVKIHNFCQFLTSMCSIFSVYYRRVRILMEPRSHLFKVLHARIYLLRAIETVLHNGLYLLNIEPVKQM